MAIVIMDHKRIGINLKHLLSELGMTQKELSERAQVTPAAISQIIDGKRIPSLETVCKILGVIPVTFERLLK